MQRCIFIMFITFIFNSLAMEKLFIECITLPPKNVLEDMIESTLLSMYVCPKELQKMYCFSECEVPACCLFDVITQWYDHFRFLQMTNTIPVNMIHQYAGYLVTRDYVYLVKMLLKRQAPIFWTCIKSSLARELFDQRQKNFNWPI